jgi:putative ABC transport system permease protein
MAITGVTAAVQMLTQAMREQADQGNGRATTLYISAYPRSQATTGDAAAIGAALDDLTARYEIEYSTRLTWSGMNIELPGGTQLVQGQIVDPDYGIIHRTSVVDGRWFTDADAERYAPALVVNEAFLERIGAGSVDSHPTVVVRGDVPVTAEIIGVMPDQWAGQEPQFFALVDDVEQWGLRSDPWGMSTPTMEVWVPPADADTLVDRIQADLSAALPTMEVSVSTQVSNTFAIDRAAKWVIVAVGGFALLLGGLGLVNIALVTVRHRIREIGIRRSFGATSSRVFFGVLMESVVATVVAGVIGVGLAVVGISNLPIDKLMGMTIQDMPGFPVSAALIGLACSAGIGALAGLLPALFAVRVKVIDAIRY